MGGLAIEFSRNPANGPLLLLSLPYPATALNRFKGHNPLSSNGVSPVVVDMRETFTYRLVQGKPGQYLGDWAVITSEVMP